jgi:hypothetical protein
VHDRALSGDIIVEQNIHVVDICCSMEIRRIGFALLTRTRSSFTFKDFKRKKDGYAWVNLDDGDADWAEVRQALAEIARFLRRKLALTATLST